MITADDIADLARNLVTQTANEVRIRCGVSRAYYAAFHYCNSAANSFCNQLTDSEKEGRGEHSKLYLRLEKHCKDTSNDSNLKLIAAEAKKLRSLRLEADYNLNATVDQKSHIRSLSHMSQVKNYLNLLK